MCIRRKCSNIYMYAVHGMKLNCLCIYLLLSDTTGKRLLTHSCPLCKCFFGSCCTVHLGFFFFLLFFMSVSTLMSAQLSGQFSQRLFRKLPPRVCVPLKNIVSEEFLRAGSVFLCVNTFVVIELVWFILTPPSDLNIQREDLKYWLLTLAQHLFGF